MTRQGFAYYSPALFVAIIAALVLWHFFIGRWIRLVLYRMGYLRYSSIDDEKRGMNEHIRLMRRIFKRRQKRHRKCYYRLLQNKDGTFMTSERNGKTMYTLQCLETGEVREMDSDWLDEALYFRIISNADNTDGGVKLVADVFDGIVPEYNEKVGDISYFNRIIGAYSDWSVVRMDVDSIMSTFDK